MQIQISLQLFFIFFSTIFLSMFVISVSGQCLNGQKSLLLKLKNTLEFDSSFSTKLVQWDEDINCCLWSGVDCDTAGHVFGLDLNNESISGGINISSSLFDLKFLQRLNLANNYFSSTQLPSGFAKLTNLAHLNLSNTEFSVRVPSELSLMTRLVTLDLSITTEYALGLVTLENPNLNILIENLTELRELYLDGLNISAHGHDWCQAISSSLPNLRVLSLSRCNLFGPLDSSLMKLQNLSVIHLDLNTFSSSVPELFSKFPHLTVLSLSTCNLTGTFPRTIFQIPTLQKIDLSNNELLEGSLPEFPQTGSLRHLDLSSTKFSGRLPDSIGNLRMLSHIDLSICNFTGSVPNSMANLTQLVHLDLSRNWFFGSLPSVSLLKNLVTLNLYQNSLTGEIPSSYFVGLDYLEYLDLGNNSLSGNIPLSVFSLPSLKMMDLSNNKFSGGIRDLANASSTQLYLLDLSENKFDGPMPKFFFKLHGLKTLSLSSNNFSGSIELSMFGNLGNLSSLDISGNKFSLNASVVGSTLSLPQFSTLNLASCKLQEFPDLRNQSILVSLDLSDNQIRGEIPNWIWEVYGGDLRFVNLSHNFFSSLQEPCIFHGLEFLDLHSNLLQGQIPVPPPSVAYVDYSGNSFATSIPADIGNRLSSAFFFSIADNNLTGIIPQSLCKASRLEVLNLSNNSLSGTIPSCLIAMSNTLGVMNLRRNNLNGIIPGTFSDQCNLKTLDLSGNHLEGLLSKSLANCTKLEVLNIGNNKINDTFPCWLKNLSTLRVFVLRSNRFHGQIHCLETNTWPNLQIIDLASNNLSGVLPPIFFLNLKAITVDRDGVQPKLDNLHFQSVQVNLIYYQDTVTVHSKRQQMELVKILTIFSSIDFSCNNFQGGIPETVGVLKSVKALNFSHNALRGQIPASVGNLKQLESLDLSCNRLDGTIPVQLASLTFLSSLNLSCNRLVGMIPRGSQLQTFTESSFTGNKGLCGVPLNTSCNATESPWLSTPPMPEDEDLCSETEKYTSVTLGFVVGLGIIFGPLVLNKRWREWCNKHADGVIRRILNQDDKGRRNRGKAYKLETSLMVMKRVSG